MPVAPISTDVPFAVHVVAAFPHEIGRASRKKTRSFLLRTFSSGSLKPYVRAKWMQEEDDFAFFLFSSSREMSIMKGGGLKGSAPKMLHHRGKKEPRAGLFKGC